jgi:hypothetical protein
MANRWVFSMWYSLRSISNCLTKATYSGLTAAEFHQLLLPLPLPLPILLGLGLGALAVGEVVIGVGVDVEVGSEVVEVGDNCRVGGGVGEGKEDRAGDKVGRGGVGVVEDIIEDGEPEEERSIRTVGGVVVEEVVEVVAVVVGWVKGVEEVDVEVEVVGGVVVDVE